MKKETKELLSLLAELGKECTILLYRIIILALMIYGLIIFIFK